MNFLDLFDWAILFLASAVTTFIVSAINVSVNKVPSKILVVIIAFVVTLLVTTFTPGMHFAEWQKLILQMIVTMSFSISFYHWGGEWLMGKIFGWVKNVIGSKLPDGESKP
jgi:glucose-6-phosphate-specific signal transduction histidine kinase